MSATLKGPLAKERVQTPSKQPNPFHPTAFMALLQGLYYAVTGIWPLISLDTFQRVTGPKTDLWLVQTVGALITVIGVVLLAAVWRRRATAEVLLLALGSAAALGAVDVMFVVNRMIAPIYLLDAAAEAMLILMWLAAWAIEAHTLWKRSETCL